ncbi:MAG: amidohydrolase family protein [Candidatus Eremiobacteraeota bacterium]|nr:amidohydrolase family protein [Candidatus Eremiobacteraeota bacterium]
MFWTIFERPRVYDGSGDAPFTTDVAVADGRVAAIGDLADRDAHERIPCNGFALAPGFIDVHSHTDELWLADPRCEGKIRQGVTTEIGGNCGTSVAPLLGSALAHKRRDARSYRLDVGWTTFDAFFTLVEREGVALNVASLVGLGTTRSCVAGPAARALEREEREAQNRLIRGAVEEGALGVSSGLIYEPGRYADLAELTAAAAAARDAGAPLYASHVRDEGDAVEDAIAEAIAVGAGAEVAVQCSHHKAAGKKNWGKVHRTLAQIDRARARGLDVWCDAYPYVASWTELATVLPKSVRDGGDDAALVRLRDPEHATAAAFAMELTRDPELGGDGWDTILVTGVASERNEQIPGTRIDALARAWRTSPARAVIRLLLEEEMRVDSVFFSMSEDDVASVFSAGFCSVGSDASARSYSGITARGVPHPRTYGTFPRVFGRYVRQRHVFDAAEAVRRMTSLPAAQFGLRERGRIAPGMHADLVVFDEEHVVDRATYERPFVPPDGIRDVFVNGRAVVRGGALTGARPGRVLRNGR